MKLKPNYFIIPTTTVMVSLVGSYFTYTQVNDWYQTLGLPAWAPPGYVIGIVWTIIYALTTISALIVWNKIKKNRSFWFTIVLFSVNAFLNVFWSYTFFYQQLIGAAVIVSALLGASVLGLITLIWPKQKRAALLLMPYLFWVSFATYLNYVIWQIN